MKKINPVLKYFLLCVLVLTMMFPLLTGCNTSDTNDTNDTTDNSTEIEDTTDDTTEDSDTTIDTPINDDGLTECYVGETVNTGTYNITLVGYETDKGDELICVPQKDEYVGVNLIIENVSEEEATVSSLLQFNCYVDGFAIDADILAPAVFGDSVDVTLASGRKVEGYLAFDVDSSWQTIEIDFTDEALWESSSVRFIVNK